MLANFTKSRLIVI
ncbi:hypothetical protein LINPERHAP2_LOCUS13249 [Linum perenne]